jgi:Alginate export
MNTANTTTQQPQLLTLGVAALLGLSGQAQANSFTDALTGGTPTLNVRLRYEHVDQDNSLKDADGVTLRTRLGYQSGKYHEVDAYVELENNSALVEDYNSGPGGNGKSQYSVIADPELTEVDQAWLAYSGLPDSLLKLGRQRMIWDNARFLGNVGWRQNEQTYDAVSIVNGSLANTAFSYAYIDNVQDIFGADTDMSDHMVNVAFNGLGFARLVAYGYFLEYDGSSGQSASSNQTLGAFLDGGYDAGGVQLLYRAEYAKQTDYKDGNSNIDADYYHFILGATVSGVTAKLGYELLGADGFSGFETPLATKHAFNGWADLFLNTPTNGLQDCYLAVGGMLRGVKLLGVYHDFQADKGGSDYGSEIDLLAARKFSKNYTAGIKYASYNADNFAVDTDKFWLWGEMTF